MSRKIDILNGLDNLQEQAESFAQKWVNNHNQKNGENYSFERAFIYHDAAGEPIYWKLRAKNYSTGSKFIRSFSSSEHGFKYGEPNFKTSYPQGNGKKPLYGLMHLDGATQDDAIYITEGEQKADLLNGLGLYATTCGGAKSADAVDLKPLRHKRIIVWADHDKAGQAFLDDIAQQLLTMGCQVDYVLLDKLNLPAKGDVVDWVQARKEKGLNTTAHDIQALEIARYEATPSTSQQDHDSKNNRIPKGHLAEPMQFDNGTFEILPSGVWYTQKNKNGDEYTLFISSAILVLAKTRDDNSNGWGRLLQWKDDAGISHTWAISMQHFQTDGAELRKALADQGVTIAVTSRERALFQTYLASYPVEQFALCVERVGWYGNQYVLPCEVIGKNANNELVVYQSSSSTINKYSTQGTLQDWQAHIAKPIQNHSVLVTALCTALAGQLLEPLGQQGKGLHIKGGSSKGKTTAVHIACTVWGNPEAYYHTWRNTSNAMEQTAYTHNDGLLVLDEIGEIPNLKEIGNIIYMLINGQGKGRMSKSLNLRESQRWRLVFLSSGEKTLSELMDEAGQKSKLGQEIRLINIDIDESQHGIFDSLDFAASGAEQSILLNTNAKRFYGTAGKAWLEYLTADKAQRIVDIKEQMEQYSHTLIGSHAQGHIVRVASFFGLLAAAGEAATQAGITGWQENTALHAVQAVFNQWLSSFEQVGDYEDKAILEHVKAFFALHGSSRFEHIEQNIIRNTAGDPIQQRIHNRVGYWKDEKDGKKYLVYPELFKSEICKGHNYRRVAKILKAHDWLDCDTNKNTKTVRLPDNNVATRVFQFNSKMFSDDLDSEYIKGNKGNKGNNLAAQGFADVAHCEIEKATTQKGATNPNIENPVALCCPSENAIGNNNKPLNINNVAPVALVAQNKTATPTNKPKSKADGNAQGELLL